MKLMTLVSEIADRYKQMLDSMKVYDIQFPGKPSDNGWKFSIVGKKITDSYELFDRLHQWLSNKNIAHKFGTAKRVNHPNKEQSKKLCTIYVPDTMDIKKLALQIEYLLKGYRGWHDIRLPLKGYTLYAGGIQYRNDRDEYGDYIPAKDTNVFRM